MANLIVVLPQLYADAFVSSAKGWGTIAIKSDANEGVVVVDGGSAGDGPNTVGKSDYVRKEHYLRGASAEPGSGIWYHVEPRLHLAGFAGVARGAFLTVEGFKQHVIGAWQMPHKSLPTLVLTYAEPPNGAHRDWSAWLIHPGEGGVEPISVALVNEDADLLAPLEGYWPLEDLHGRVLVVGVGSIGSAACEALATYGARNLILVDNDRLLDHNFARHRVLRDQLGRSKVAALADHLTARDARMQIKTCMADVIYDADVVRPLLDGAEVVLVCSDGVDSRRAANLLARRAGLPAVFACVLGDGSFGEIIRIRPPMDGCLECLRSHMREAGQINPEPSLDRRYGTGTRHLPMTAVGGDLHLIGHFAAKATVATLLEARGYRDQRLPGGHAIVGLRPKPDLARPFDMAHAGEVRWHDIPPSREKCVACNEP